MNNNSPDELKDIFKGKSDKEIIEIMQTWFLNNYRCINAEEFYENEDHYLDNWNHGWDLYEELSLFWGIVDDELIGHLASKLTNNCPSWVKLYQPTVYTFPQKKIIAPEERIITDTSAIHNAIPELIEYLKTKPQDIHLISPRKFEEIIAEIFRSQGFETYLTSRTKDGGKDIIAIQNNNLGIKTKYFIECKKYAPNNKVGVEIVRSLYGVHHTKGAANQSIIATTSTFTKGARQFVENETRSQWEISLQDYSNIISWISGYR